MKKDKKKKKEKMPISQESLEVSVGDGMQALRMASEELGGKWRLRVLWALREQVGRRYGEVKADIPEITDMMLSQSLRELCKSKLVERHQYQEIPPRVEYRILEDGSKLIPLLEELIKWEQTRVCGEKISVNE